MEKELSHTLKEMMGISPGSQLEFIFESVSQVAPYVGKVITAYKIHRLEKRFKEHETRIKNIQQKIEWLSPELIEFVKGRVFPFVLEDLLNEAQDQKVEFILNGFEVVIEKEFTEEDKIISYFDILRQLRVDELMSLLNYDYEYFRMMEEKRKNIGLSNEADVKKIIDGYYTYINSRLSSFGLVARNDKDAYGELIDYIEQKFNGNDRFSFGSKSRVLWSMENRIEDYKLTKFGQDFINFILNR
jgi:bifunctional DNA-binding transcriptional regulator/antitoxin component of YhaV-PrlF toxin-antitoxin module